MRPTCLHLFRQKQHITTDWMHKLIWESPYCLLQRFLSPKVKRLFSLFFSLEFFNKNFIYVNTWKVSYCCFLKWVSRLMSSVMIDITHINQSSLEFSIFKGTKQSCFKKCLKTNEIWNIYMTSHKYIDSLITFSSLQKFRRDLIVISLHL